MAEDITLKVITETKGLQEKINSSSLSKEDKSVLSAKLSEALNLKVKVPMLLLKILVLLVVILEKLLMNL